MFSKACEYGIKATIHIALRSQQNKRTGLKEIAEEIASPEAFTAKILQLLVKSQIIDSVKGPTGGFEMAPHQLAKVRLSQIVSAIDGDRIYKGCGLGLKECNEKKPCPVHDKFKIIRDELRMMLETTRVQELALGLTGGMTFLKR
jgi:Rrf2 family iron-sulfur cluster assembly transcriptional regulator